MKLNPLSILLILGLGCAAESAEPSLDPEGECGLCTGKADSWDAPEEGGCEAEAILNLVNTASFEALDDDVALNSRAVTKIVEARDPDPLTDLAALDAVPYVGITTLNTLLAYVRDNGSADMCLSADDSQCGTGGALSVANEASFETLDIDVGLDRRAADSIVAGRPFATIEELDAASYVGVSALERLANYAEMSGATQCVDQGDREQGIISDLDKTVIPPEANLALPEAPYPGVTRLYQILEFGVDNSKQAGDMNFVTARNPERVVDIPDWLELHEIPGGPIQTGLTGVPWLAQAEKVRDITEIFEGNPMQKFVLFGDTSHRDPEAYKEILTMFPEQMQAGLIHKVTNTVGPQRIVGLHLYENYAEAAAILVGLEIITQDEAYDVYETAVDEGLEVTETEFEALLAEHAN